MKKTFLLAGFVCFTALSACDSERRTAQNEGYQDTDTAEVTTNNETDPQSNRIGNDMDDTQEFVTEAASGGMMEVELGKIVQEKATNAQVKDFAAMMVKDHSAANDKLKSIVQSKNMQLPQQMSEDHQEKIDKFSKMEAGADFDKEYVNLMVEDHEDDIEEFEEAQKEVQDTEIKQWVESTLPTLRQHKQHVDSLKNTLENTRS